MKPRHQIPPTPPLLTTLLFVLPLSLVAIRSTPLCLGYLRQTLRTPRRLARVAWPTARARSRCLSKVPEMNQLLRLFAARTGCELVMQNIINDSSLERQAVYDHRAWLETIYLVCTLPSWSRNLTRRVKKRPKVFIADPGLASWLLGKTPAALENPTDPATGQLVETFVYAELRRQL